MKYKNKNDERLRSRLIETVDEIVSANKMKPPRSSIRAAKFNIGRIINKTSEYDKAMKRYKEKIEKPQEIEKKDTSIKAYNKGNVSYIKYKGNEIPVSNLFRLAKTDNDINNLVRNITKQKAEQGFNGTFNEFLMKQYS